MKNLLVAAAVAAACIAAACSSTSTTPAVTLEPPVAAAPGEKPDFLRANMDLAANPGDDFFEYANGTWLKNHPIPASESNWGIGNAVVEQLYVSLRQINEKAVAAKAEEGSEQRKIADFWTTAMDTQLAEARGVHPIDAELARIDAIKTTPDLLDVVFALQADEVPVLFSFYVQPDEKHSDVEAVHLWQDGLGLPDRDFYFNPEEGVGKVRDEYVAHIARTLMLLGRDEASARASATRVMDFERTLARSSRKLAALRDPNANYHRMAPAQVTRQYTPSIKWAERFKAWSIQPAYVIVGQPEFFTAMERAIKVTPLPVLQDYLRFHTVSAYSDTLSKNFDDEKFAFYKKVLNGQQQPRDRWKRVLDAEENAMGMVLGKIFVDEFFPAATKQRYVTLVESVRTAYRERIDKLDWMSAATRAKARAKLDAMTLKVGYPDKWKDYSALVVGRDSYAANMRYAAQWKFQDSIHKLGKPVDRTEWDMTPQTYNAYYNPSNNEIVLPAAAFIVPGVADADIDDAVVYGYAAASTIGHEITHGFDDEGRQFDAKGNLHDWWTKQDAQRFTQHAQVMVDQFDAYEPLPGLHINGKAALGENIADYGGVLLGLDAFKKTEQYKRGEKIGGLTPTQRFFVGYALGWMTQMKEQRLRARLLSDVHAPAKWRVIGPLSNVPEFWEVFGVEPGQAMRRPDDQRVQIW